MVFMCEQKESAMLVVEIPMPTPSLNVYKRMHYHAQRRLRDQYTTLLRAHTTRLNRAKPHEFRRVTICRHGARLLDIDNLIGGAKPLVDALRRAGLLWNDSPEYCAIKYEQVKVGAKRSKVVVTVH